MPKYLRHKKTGAMCMYIESMDTDEMEVIEEDATPLLEPIKEEPKTVPFTVIPKSNRVK